MQIRFSLFVERGMPVEGSLQRPSLLVFIETPSFCPTDESIAESFGRHKATLSRLENRGERIFSFVVNVPSIEGIAPPSRYLETLCSYLRELPFWLAPRTPSRPLMLTIGVPQEEEDAAGVDRSHPHLAEATSKIGTALWENAHVCAAQYLYLDVVAVPDSTVLDLLVHGRSSDANPSVTVRVCDRPGSHDACPDVLEISLAGAQFVAVGGSSCCGNGTERASFPAFGVRRSPWQIFCMFSSNVVAAVTTSLLDHRNHNYVDVRFLCADRHLDDGTYLCAAAVQCSSIATVTFDR